VADTLGDINVRETISKLTPPIFREIGKSGLLRKIKLPDRVPLRACVDVDEGLVIVVYQALGDFRIAFCNVNELLCIKWVMLRPIDILAVLVTEETARRVASGQVNPEVRSGLLKVADFVEQILAPMARFILGEDISPDGLVDAARRLVEAVKPRYTYNAIYSTIFEELDRLREALGGRSFRKLRERLKRAVERSYLGDDRTWNEGVLYIPRDERNSLLPSEASGVIVSVRRRSVPKPRHLLDAFEAMKAFITFKNREVFDIVVNAFRGAPQVPVALITGISFHFDNLDKFKDLSKEDVLRLLEASLKTAIESYKTDSVASTTLRLSDGRKLHIIVPRTSEFLSRRFEHILLLLSNHEIRVTDMFNYMWEGRFENNEEAIKYVTEMSEEDIARLDEETKIAILKLLFAKALTS